MSTPAQLGEAGKSGEETCPSLSPSRHRLAQLRQHMPTVPEAFATLMSLVVVALFLNTFVLQPYLIPSESM